MVAMLNNWGYQYETAADGATALLLLREAAELSQPFRVVLLDHKTPDMEGSELGRRIKADPLVDATLLVLVTSLGQHIDVLALEQIGFSGYLTKPVRQSQLYDCIALVMAKANQSAGNFEPFERSTNETNILLRNDLPESAKKWLRILLVEDNIINQKVAQSILHKLGYRADVAADGQEALRALEMINYDLVLMDCQMPEMDGFEATRVIRDVNSNVINHAVPIIAMTANAMIGDREECIKSGMDDYLTKPVKKDEMAELLEKWLVTVMP